VKILFIGVFDNSRKSTNTSQLLAFKKLGFDVVGYNYKDKAFKIGAEERDEHLCDLVEKRNFDLVVFSKCNFLPRSVFTKINELSKTCLWFMDPLVTYDQIMKERTRLVDYICCDKENVIEEALKINKNSFHVCEGFDQDVDKPHNIEKEYDVSFIGNIYGDRANLLEKIKYPVNVINNAYASQHAIEVSKSRINLNFCTTDGASDRVYKILAAGGFLLSDDWKNRKKYLIDEKECVIFKDIDDLNKKIDFYLKNPGMREQISKQGMQSIQQFNRINWAKRITELSFEC